jgi:hypothetical protein
MNPEQLWANIIARLNAAQRGDACSPELAAHCEALGKNLASGGGMPTNCIVSPSLSKFGLEFMLYLISQGANTLLYH